MRPYIMYYIIAIIYSFTMAKSLITYIQVYIMYVSNYVSIDIFIDNVKSP